MNQNVPLQSAIELPLKKLSEEEAKHVLQTSRAAHKCHAPMSLGQVLKKWKYPKSIPEFLADISVLLGEIDSDSEAMEFKAAHFMEMMTVRFERLVDAGAFDSVLPNLTALPTLYSLSAGKGAGEWDAARLRFLEKKVGTKSLVQYYGDSPKISKHPHWGRIAESAVRVANVASGENSRVLSDLKSRATAYWIEKRQFKANRIKFRATLFQLDNNATLWWPDWLDSCSSLPPRVVEDPQRYEQAVRAILDSFFADPNETQSDPLLEHLMKNGYSSRAMAVNEAKKSILAYIERF